MINLLVKKFEGGFFWEKETQKSTLVVIGIFEVIIFGMKMESRGSSKLIRFLFPSKRELRSNFIAQVTLLNPLYC